MRARVDRARLISFLDALGAAASAGAHVYLVGGAIDPAGFRRRVEAF